MSEQVTDETTEPAEALMVATPSESFVLTAVRFVALLYVVLIGFIAVAILLSGLAAGWRPYQVTSGSMVPTMNPGDLVIVEPKTPGKAYDPPTIITFNDPERGVVTHRILRAERVENGEVRYTTKGDFNRDPESGTVGQADVIGSVRFVLRKVGLPMRWAQTQDWGPFSLWASVSLLAIWLAMGLMRAPVRQDTGEPPTQGQGA